tara:strand:+ start:8707 stop:8922 length:216 start_codon:yes stop_codon:yes gene_type:complete
VHIENVAGIASDLELMRRNMDQPARPVAEEDVFPTRVAEAQDSGIDTATNEIGAFEGIVVRTVVEATEALS